MRPLVLLAVSAVALGATAGAASPTAAQQSAPTPVVIRMTDGLQFRPAQVKIRRGTRVTWRNVGGIAHTITTVRSKAASKANARVPVSARAWDSGFVGAQRSYSRVFTVPGTYRYFCVPHEGARMIGTIVVV